MKWLPEPLGQEFMFLTFSKARLSTSGSYGVDGIDSENQWGLYQRLSPPSLLEYKWPGGKHSNCSQSSFKPLSSDDIQIEPEYKHKIMLLTSNSTQKLCTEHECTKKQNRFETLPSSPQPI